MNLAYQRRVAARLLKCGLDRVWVDDRPEYQERIDEAVTRDDVRQLIIQKFIRKHQKRGISRGRARHRDAQRAKGRQRGHGSRRGHGKARTPKKEAWMTRIRALRDELRQLRGTGILTASQYRHYYRRAKGGMYNSRAHLRAHIQTDGIEVEQ
ncbi:MAG: 50S ribosomal protein L19e [Candidatus Poseidoniia archaeon]|jgi:large subunit ribosomal protein L19e|nr:50S ribosomal protein L19e [Candidatus Poseidoniia archaeon]|tara:strand:+ start:1534 stop:1992 length:459 start_codon:yes stop_codon:yes gene_type:complete